MMQLFFLVQATGSHHFLEDCRSVGNAVLNGYE